MRSVRAFAKRPTVREIVVVTPPAYIKKVQRWVGLLSRKKNISTVPGGPFRGASVCNGVLALSSRVDVVLVHDAARPLVTPAIIERVEKAAWKNGAALAAWPLADTLKQAAPSGFVKKTIPRKNLWLAQTPQGFRRDIALKCLCDPSPAATDDVELAERKGYRVRLVEGGPSNFKVTYRHDLPTLRALVL